MMTGNCAQTLVQSHASWHTAPSSGGSRNNTLIDKQRTHNFPPDVISERIMAETVITRTNRPPQLLQRKWCKLLETIGEFPQIMQSKKKTHALHENGFFETAKRAQMPSERLMRSQQLMTDSGHIERMKDQQVAAPSL